MKSQMRRDNVEKRRGVEGFEFTQVPTLPTLPTYL